MDRGVHFFFFFTFSSDADREEPVENPGTPTSLDKATWGGPLQRLAEDALSGNSFTTALQIHLELSCSFEIEYIPWPPRMFPCGGESCSTMGTIAVATTVRKYRRNLRLSGYCTLGAVM